MNITILSLLVLCTFNKRKIYFSTGWTSGWDFKCKYDIDFWQWRSKGGGYGGGPPLAADTLPTPLIADNGVGSVLVTSSATNNVITLITASL